LKHDPLANLRDIHMPEPVSWWPPAPGWWLLLVMILLLVAGLFWWVKKRKTRQAKPTQFSQREVIKQALAELDRLDGLARADAAIVATELSALLRRAAIGLKPDDERIAGLSGDNWLNWLDAQWDERAFSDGDGRTLLDAPYQRHGDVEIEKLLQLVRRWIRAQR